MVTGAGLTWRKAFSPGPQSPTPACRASRTPKIYNKHTNHRIRKQQTWESNAVADQKMQTQRSRDQSSLLHWVGRDYLLVLRDITQMHAWGMIIRINQRGLLLKASDNIDPSLSSWTTELCQSEGRGVNSRGPIFCRDHPRDLPWDVCRRSYTSLQLLAFIWVMKQQPRSVAVPGLSLIVWKLWDMHTWGMLIRINQRGLLLKASDDINPTGYVK